VLAGDDCIEAGDGQSGHVVGWPVERQGRHLGTLLLRRQTGAGW
jgi:hypothetical protein